MKKLNEKLRWEFKFSAKGAGRAGREDLARALESLEHELLNKCEIDVIELNEIIQTEKRPDDE